MTLWLYSSGDADLDYAVDADLVQRLGDGQAGKLRFTFLASAYTDSTYYLKEFAARFAQHGVKNCQLFNVDKPFTQKSLRQVLKSDLMYLSGGNTFYFLKHLKSSGMAKELTAFYKGGGHLAGTSAGAIILTRSIKTAGYPDFDRDDNLVGISDLRALGLARFEFFPHYIGGESYNEELAFQSTQCGHPLYAVADGGAIAVDREHEKLTFYGRVTGFMRGIRFKPAG